MAGRKIPVWVVQPLWVPINESPRTMDMMAESQRDHYETRAFMSQTEAQEYFKQVCGFQDMLDDDYWYKDSCIFEASIKDGPYIKSCSRS